MAFYLKILLFVSEKLKNKIYIQKRKFYILVSISCIMINELNKIFRNAYDEGYGNNSINIDSWLKKFGLDSISLKRLKNPKPSELFIGRSRELEQVAQLIGLFEKEKKFSILNISGYTGVGKTHFMNTISQLYHNINPKKVIHQWDASDFSKLIYENEGDENDTCFDDLMSKIIDGDVILIDNCEFDLERMGYNIQQLASYKVLVILNWEQNHWNCFKLISGSDFGNIIQLEPFNNEVLTKLLIEKIKRVKKIKVKIDIIKQESIKKISELSCGFVKIALDILIKSIEQSFKKDRTSITNKQIEECFFEEGYLSIKQFLEESKPVILQILKTILLASEPKGIHIEQISYNIDLDRTSIFYHLKKIRNVNLLNETTKRKFVYFSIKEKYKSFVEKAIWENRVC